MSDSIKMDGETVCISQKEYNQLKRAMDFLSCLEVAGVDDWDGYDYARELMGEDNG